MSRSNHDDTVEPPAETDNAAKTESQQDSSRCLEHVRELAYFKWQEAGCPDCDGVAFWIRAESELRAELHPGHETKAT